MASTAQTLIDFINIAEKNRNYPEGTASGYKAAVRLFEPELNEQEKDSLDLFKEHLNQIFQTVFQKNKNKMTPNTIETYRKRILKLLEDYEIYGTDPSKMASWRRPVRQRTINKNVSPIKVVSPPVDNNGDGVTETNVSPAMTRFELTLRPGIKAIILTPSDITLLEIKKIKGYIEYLENSLSE